MVRVSLIAKNIIKILIIFKNSVIVTIVILLSKRLKVSWILLK